MFSFSATYVALWIVVIVEALLVLAILQQLAQFRRLIEQGSSIGSNGLPIGSRAPEFSGGDSQSGSGVQDLDGRGGLILFLSSDCSVCNALVDSISRLGKDNHLPYTFALCVHDREACSELLYRMGSKVQPITLGAEETAARYGVSGFPTAIAVDERRRIRGYGHPNDGESLKRFFTRSLAEGIEVTTPQPESVATLTN